MSNMYERLGVKRVINAWGTVTALGGSIMDERVLEAMEEGAKSFVSMKELHEKAGAYIASILGVEACCITCGAAAGLAIATAACMTGMRKSFAYQLPDTAGMKDEILVLKCHRNLYDQSISETGAHFVEIGVTSHAFLQQVEDKISDRTCALFYTIEAEEMRGSIPLKDLAELLKPYRIPIIVDAAAEIPPAENIHKFLDEGASLVVFSGGKELRGPQASGLILGKKEYIRACDMNCCPEYGIGRAMKIDKENICGLVRAIELFSKKDYQKELERWASMSQEMYERLRENPNLEVSLGTPSEPGVQPACILRVFITPKHMTATELHQRLIEGSPCVYTFLHGCEIMLNPQCLREEEVSAVVDAINSV